MLTCVFFIFVFINFFYILLLVFHNFYIFFISNKIFLLIFISILILISHLNIILKTCFIELIINKRLTTMVRSINHMDLLNYYKSNKIKLEKYLSFRNILILIKYLKTNHNDNYLAN